jgi:hypothetical protein
MKGNYMTYSEDEHRTGAMREQALAVPEPKTSALTAITYSFMCLNGIEVWARLV